MSRLLKNIRTKTSTLAQAIGIHRPNLVEPEAIPSTPPFTVIHNVENDHLDEAPEDESNTEFLISATSIVQLEYDGPKWIPPLSQTEHGKGEAKWTRFVCISDSHSRTYNVPDGDVLLHCGDLTRMGRLGDFQETLEWLYGLPHKVKIVIAGNHDLTLDRKWYEANWKAWHRHGHEDYNKIFELLTGDRAKEAGIVYLEDQIHTFSLGPDRREWTVYGSPWSPYFNGWAFGYPHDEAEAWVSEYKQADILLTHGPPAGIFDYVTRLDQFAGCPALASRLASGELRPRLHAFGHIHEAHGAAIHSWVPTEPGVLPEAPEIQNSFFYEQNRNDEHNPLRGQAPGGPELDRTREEVAKEREGEKTRSLRDELESTVFVNAANQPSGSGMYIGGRKVGFGGPNFRPVVVDLKD